MLGAEANVRILRALCLDPSPVSRTELGRRAELEARGAHTAANRLLEEGILRRVGSGTRQQVQLENRHPLASALQSLFRAEEARSERLVTSLRKNVLKLSKSLEAAWIESDFASELDRPGDPIVIGVLGRGNTLGQLIDKLRSQLSDLETAEDVTIEVVGYTTADLAAAPPEMLKRLTNAHPIFGLPPMWATPRGKEDRIIRNRIMHGDREQQQLILAKAVSEILNREPGRLDAARKFIESRLENASAQERRELHEWQLLLKTMSPSRLQRFLTDRSERATRLRQTMPFALLLTPTEREELLRKHAAHDT